MRLSRADKSLLTEWWFTVDRPLVTSVLILFAVGLVVSLAASPAVAIKKGLPTFFFVERHIIFAALGVPLMLTLSLLEPRGVRRVALFCFVAGIAAMIAVIVAGPEINGSRRWLRYAGLSLQPSEFVKPAFVVLSAWALSQSDQRVDMPARLIAGALFVLFAGLLLAQPDLGQTALIVAVWGSLLILAGLPLIYPGVLAGLGIVVLAIAYFSLGYVQRRIDTFLSGDVAATDQAGRAARAFIEGGFFGRGPGEGSIKTALPDAHTDFIFAVVAEEYGAVGCLALLGLYAFIVVRSIMLAIRRSALADRFAILGLATLFGGQVLINTAVNVGLLPAKGMTLPLISAGGSSILAISVTLGLLVALSRRRPEAARLRGGRFAATPDV